MSEEKTATEISMRDEYAGTRLDGIVRPIMRLVDEYAVHNASAARHGNQYGDVDGLKALRERIDAEIRKAITDVVTVMAGNK